VKAPESEPETFLKVEGKKWKVTEISELDDVPAYTCISYIWGGTSERVGNPFHPDFGPAEISSHTLSSLSAAIKTFQSQTPAFWIDAFCIPVYDKNKPETRNEKYATLESMGYIYHMATQVAVILSNESYASIAYMVDNMRLRKSVNSIQTNISFSTTFNPTLGMSCLENDRWISSVWTYQEVMGNGNLFFSPESDGGAPLRFIDCFNAIGLFASKHFDILKKAYPLLDAFLVLGGDWMMGAENYALKIMANLDRRRENEEKNYWYARISALTTEKTKQATRAADKDLAQKFMDICERLDDYSFIFSSAKRESEQDPGKHKLPLRRWRPRPGKLPSVLPEHNSGSPQRGRQLDDGSLELHGITVYRIEPQTISDKTIRWLKSLKDQPGYHYLSTVDLSSPELDIHNTGRECFKILQAMGFQGSSDYVLVEDGFFFPQWSVLPSERASVLVSTAILYVLGAPALLMDVDEHDNYSYTPGILMGEVAAKRRTGEPVLLK
jgi:hypothetical protein